MPKEVFGDDYVFLPKNELLSFEEIERFAKLFALLGVKKLRLTGGEPLMRRELPKLVEKLMTIEGIEDIGLTTNGVLLKQYAQPLYDAGLRRLNMSLDALDPSIFGKLNGRGIKPQLILSNIDYAQKIGFDNQSKYGCSKRRQRGRNPSNGRLFQGTRYYATVHRIYGCR